MVTTRILLLGALCRALAGQAGIQEVAIRTYPYVPLAVILRADTNLVETPLVVRDGRGRFVGGLTEANFKVMDNGAERQIVSFVETRLPARGREGQGPSSKETETALAGPKFVTFFFDDLHTSNGQMLSVKKGAREYIVKGLMPGDHLSIVTASGQGDLDFTTDAEVFARAIEHLSSHIRSVVPAACGVGPVDSYIFLHKLDWKIMEEAIAAAMPCAGCGPHEPPASCRSKAYAIAESAANTTWEQLHFVSLDTISGLNFAVKRLAQMNGSRTLVLLSSGFLLRPGMPPELQNLTNSAIRNKIVVHAIGAQGLDSNMAGGGASGSTRMAVALMPLQNITNATGGHFFKNDNDLGAAMEQAAEPESTYTLAFQASSPDGKFHQVKIVSNLKNGHELEYRPGYFSPDPKQEAPARAKLDAVVNSDQKLSEFPVAVSLVAEQPRGAAIPISVRFTVDVKALGFVPHHGRHAQQLVFVAALLDANGAYLNGEESIMDLDLTAEKLESMRKTGLKAVGTLITEPGKYRVRAVVREGVKGRIAAVSAPFELRGR